MQPSISFLDIETAPDVVWTWGVYQANAIQVKEDWYILSFAAKWKDEEPWFVGLNDFRGYKGGNSTEKQLLEKLWHVLDKADIVVAHNGRHFDVRKINARFIDHGFPPPSPYKVIDTKSDLAMVAAFSSNRLNWLTKQFKLGSKTQEHQDFELWKGCMTGDAQAWAKMEAYNLNDVVLLERLYDKVSPWIKQPNATLYTGLTECVKPGCGGKLQKRGFAYAETRVYQLFRCAKCGAPARTVKSERGATVRGA